MFIKKSVLLFFCALSVCPFTNIRDADKPTLPEYIRKNISTGTQEHFHEKCQQINAEKDNEAVTKINLVYAHLKVIKM